MASLAPLPWSNALGKFFGFREKAEDQIFPHTIPPPKGRRRSRAMSIPFALGYHPSAMNIE